jgi:hypothetical protein
MEPVYTEVISDLFIRPVKAFRTIVDEQLDRYSSVFLFALAILNALQRTVSHSSTFNNSTILYLILAIIGSGIASVMYMTFLSAAISFTGRWLGGTSNREEIRYVLIYPFLVVCLIYLISIPYTIAYGDFPLRDGFSSDGLEGSSYWLSKIVTVVGTILILYFFVLMVIGISIVQELSIGKAILNLFLSLLLITIPLMLFALFLLLANMRN